MFLRIYAIVACQVDQYGSLEYFQGTISVQDDFFMHLFKCQENW